MPKRSEDAVEVLSPKIEKAAKKEVEVKTAPKVVHRFLVEEAARKLLREIGPKMEGYINDVVNQDLIDDTTKEKVSACFMAFSPKGSEDEAIDDKFNIERIKDVLYHYHTAPETVPVGKLMLIQVLLPDDSEDDGGGGKATMLCFQEI